VGVPYVALEGNNKIMISCKKHQPMRKRYAIRLMQK